MLVFLIKYIKGYVRVQIKGDSLERFLNLCCHHKINIWKLKLINEDYEFCILLPDFYKLKPLLKKTKITVIHKIGIPFYLHRNRKRKMYYISVLMCIMLIFFWSSFIWDIHFVGNKAQTDETLLNILESYDIRPGIRKNEVDCARLAKEIRKEFHDIVWVSVSVEGCNLIVHVKENDGTDGESVRLENDIPKDLAAQKDAVIKEIITRKGMPNVQKGDVVKAGDILVTGKIEVTNDAGEVIAYQYENADADIIGLTSMKYSNKISKLYQKKIYQKKEKTNYILQIGTVEIVIGSTIFGDTNENTEILKWMKQVKFGENTYLSIYFGKQSYKKYDVVEAKYTKKDIQEILSREFSIFCTELQKKGVQIIENNVKILIDENQAAATGSLSLLEPLGEPVDTEIITIERNEVDESFRNNY